MEVSSASLSKFKNLFNKYLLKADYVQGNQESLPDASPVLNSQENVRSTHAVPKKLSFPEKAFIQNSLGGPS